MVAQLGSEVVLPPLLQAVSAGSLQRPTQWRRTSTALDLAKISRERAA